MTVARASGGACADGACHQDGRSSDPRVAAAELAPPPAELGPELAPAGCGSGARARRWRSSDLLPWLVLPDGAFFSLCGPERRRCKHLEDSDWVMAMQEELNNFTRNEVWVLEASPKNKNIIGTKSVSRNKQDEHGVVIRNKARLVAKGSIKSKVWILVKPLLWSRDLKLSASFLLTLHIITLSCIKWM